MKITHESSVTPDQIDHLGHMNVRFYGVNARAGTMSLLAGLGLTEDDTQHVDLYTRHFTEQLEGADLEIRTAIIGADPERITLYHELRNIETEALAASFVHGIGGRSDSFDLELVAGLRADAVSIPGHGAPRSISLDTDLIMGAPSLNEAVEFDLAVRMPRAITAEECASDGAHLDAFLTSMSWMGERVDGSTNEPTLVDGPNGEKIGFAAMENRICVRRRVRLGDTIQTFEAVVELADKATHRVQWVYDLDRGDLIHAQESVSVAFDTISRRAVSLPPSVHQREEKRYCPGFLPSTAVDPTRGAAS